jgi:hypothetical protein
VLVKDFNRAVLKADIAFLERILHKDYVHQNLRGTAENRLQSSKATRTPPNSFCTPVEQCA